MKSTYMFRDQVNTVTNWFGAWNECEQTVALYSLLRKIVPAQARFLQQVLDQSVSTSTDIQLLESQANNPAYINNLCKESKEQAVARLLKCLPLLKPHNEDAKKEYLKIIPKILAHSIDNGCHIEESRQLLSYSLIHPAINCEERSKFNLWLGHLEDRFSHGNYQQQQQQQSGPDQHMLYMDKNNGATSNGGLTQNYIHGMNGWQMATSRDSGIAMNEMDSASSGLQSFTVNGSNVCSAPGGRPITSVSAVNGGSVGDVTTTVNSLSNGTPGLLQPKEHLPLQATLSGPAAFNSVPSSQGGVPVASVKNHKKLSRSSSIVPPNGGAAPSSNVSDWLNKHHNEMVRSVRPPPTTTIQTQEHPHAPLSPQSSISSSGSGSDCHQDEGQTGQTGQQARNTFLEDKSGMRDVPIWLKSLRLHKYAVLFQQLRYDEMLNLTENWLTSQGVTKGARNKIVISIKKLRERQNILRAMEKDIMECCNLKSALTDIKGILNTPIKAFTRSDAARLKDVKSLGKQSDDSDSSGKGSSQESRDGDVREIGLLSTEGESTSIPEGDLPGQITRVLGKLCTQLLVTSRLDDECFAMYLQLLDKCMMHEAFNADQKKKLLSWKQQIQKIWQPAHRKYLEQRKSFGAVYPNLLRGQRALRGQQMVQQPGQPKWTFNSHPTATVGGAPVPPNTANMPMYQNALNAYAAQPAMFEMPKQGVARTHSAPIKSNQYGFSLTPKPVQDMSVTEPELTARLDSLCLSMTEHALGSLGDTEACNLDRGATF